MLCPTCTIRAFCQCACDLIESELSQYEVPLREILMTPKQLEDLADRHAEAEYYRSTEEPCLEESHILDVFNEERIKLAMEELTPRQREILQLFYWEGLSQYQIAEKLGVIRATIEGHIRAAHVILRKYLINSLKTPIQTQLSI